MPILESLVKIVEQHGIVGAGLIVLLLAVYALLVRMNKKNNATIRNGFEEMAKTLTEALTRQNDALVTAIASSNERTQERLFELISRTLDDKEAARKKRHSASLDKRAELGEKIDSILFEMLHRVNAQRTIMLEFHNSKENLDGLAFMWYDIQYEKQQKGITSLSSKARNMQATNLRPIINRVNASKSHIIHLTPQDIEDIYKESTVLHSQFKEVGITHMVYSGVYNLDTNEMIGLVGIEYQGAFPFHDDYVDDVYIKEKTAIIEHLYSNAQVTDDFEDDED